MKINEYQNISKLHERKDVENIYENINTSERIRTHNFAQKSKTNKNTKPKLRPIRNNSKDSPATQIQNKPPFSKIIINFTR